MEEILQLCDTEGNPSGSAPRSICHKNPDLVQMVVYLFILDSSGRIFIQKRAKDKDSWPGRWDTAVGGHVSAGEGLSDALRREAMEELGIVPGKADFVFRYLNRKQYETELAFVFRTVYDGPFNIDNIEVEEARFFSEKEIREKTGKDFFTPDFEKQFYEICG